MCIVHVLHTLNEHVCCVHWTSRRNPHRWQLRCQPTKLMVVSDRAAANCIQHLDLFSSTDHWSRPAQQSVVGAVLLLPNGWDFPANPKEWDLLCTPARTVCRRIIRSNCAQCVGISIKLSGNISLYVRVVLCVEAVLNKTIRIHIHRCRKSLADRGRCRCPGWCVYGLYCVAVQSRWSIWVRRTRGQQIAPWRTGSGIAVKGMLRCTASKIGTRVRFEHIGFCDTIRDVRIKQAHRSSPIANRFEKVVNCIK